jgi:transposase
MKGLKLLLPEQRMGKEMMRTPEAVGAMQRLYGLGWGLRRIAEEWGCSRNTVKHYVHPGGWVPYRSPQRPRKLAHLESWLATGFRQPRGNADGVRQELQRVQRMTVSLRTVERAIQPWRQERDAEARATVRFETAPGRPLQIGFGTTTVLIGAERVTLHLLVATLGFSRRALVRVFDHERQSAWRDGREGAFPYFGGLPEEVLPDNA